MTIGQEQLMKMKVGVGERSWSWRKENTALPLQLKTPTRNFLTISHATAHNLKNVTAHIPIGALTVVMMIGDRESKRHVRFPSEEIVVG